MKNGLIPKGFAVLLLVLLLVCACDKTDSSGRLAKLYKLYDAGNYEEAFTQTKEYLTSYPQSHSGYALLGHCAERLDRDEEALKSYTQALKLKPDSPDVLVGMGVLKRKAGDLKGAAVYYHQALMYDPKWADAYGSLVVIELMLKHDQKAVKMGEKGYKLDPKNPVIVANLAVAYHFAGNLQKRDEFTEKARKLGYPKMDKLEKIYSGELTIRDE